MYPYIHMHGASIHATQLEFQMSRKMPRVSLSTVREGEMKTRKRAVEREELPDGKRTMESERGHEKR
jgi:hypothetical protein